jgi:hypothetical protein
LKDLALDSYNNLWIATENGLSFLNAATLKKIRDSMQFVTSEKTEIKNLFKTFSTEDGLPVNYITNVTELRKGKIALGSSEGLTIFDYPVDSTEGFTSLRNIETFNFHSGFPVRKVREFQNSLYVDKQGILWIACASEKAPLIRFDYDALHRNHKLPLVNIRQIKINEELIAWQTLKNSNANTDSAKNILVIVLGKLFRLM